ncbi:hypothetical protein N9R27_01120 [Flavobacteriaceae bacterium]|nr:hypothetical protein [Flavobacteriaceae bacterium]
MAASMRSDMMMVMAMAMAMRQQFSAMCVFSGDELLEKHTWVTLILGLGVAAPIIAFQSL